MPGTRIPPLLRVRQNTFLSVRSPVILDLQQGGVRGTRCRCAFANESLPHSSPSCPVLCRLHLPMVGCFLLLAPSYGLLSLPWCVVRLQLCVVQAVHDLRLDLPRRRFDIAPTEETINFALTHPHPHHVPWSCCRR